MAKWYHELAEPWSPGTLASELVQWAALRLSVYVGVVLATGTLFIGGAFIYSTVVPLHKPAPSSSTLDPFSKDVGTASVRPRKSAANSIKSDSTPNANPVPETQRIGAEFIKIVREGSRVTATVLFANTFFSPARVVVDLDGDDLIYVPLTDKRWSLVSISGIKACSFETECISNESRKGLATIVGPRSSFIVVLGTNQANGLPEIGTKVSIAMRLQFQFTDDDTSKWRATSFWEGDLLVQELH